MNPSSWTEWVAWAGIVLPLFVFAFSAMSYVKIESDKAKNNRYEQFFHLMEQIGKKDYSIAAKMAAVYELRKFSEYKDVIVRLMITAKIGGSDAAMLEKEFDLTAHHFGAKRSND